MDRLCTLLSPLPMDGVEQYDTFSEHYRDLHRFFDNLPNLLRDEESRFSFFHGLGATSMTFYQCYTHVSEMHLQEIGLKTEWHEVPMTDQGTVTWDGIVRRVGVACWVRGGG